MTPGSKLQDTFFGRHKMVSNTINDVLSNFDCKVGYVFSIIIVSILLLVKIGLDDHRKDAT